jgi:hypothetical protein
MVWWGVKRIYMRFFAVLAAFGLAILFRLRTGAFLFFTGDDVTVKTYIFVVAPLAIGAFVMAFMIPEPSPFAP